MQLWALGRTAPLEGLRQEGPYDVVSASDIPIDKDHATPRALTVDEITEYVQWYAQASKNAILAGFDGMCRVLYSKRTYCNLICRR